MKQDRRLGWKAALALGTGLGCVLSAPAWGQGNQSARSIDANGIDVVNGTLVMQFKEGSVGSGETELALVRRDVNDQYASQWDGTRLQRLQIMTGSGLEESVEIGHGSGVSRPDVFKRVNGGGFVNQRANGATLTGQGDSYQYTAADGTVTLFGDPSGDPNGGLTAYCWADANQYSCQLMPLSITQADGSAVTMEYETVGFSTDDSVYPPPMVYSARLVRVASTHNYAIQFSYQNNDGYFGGPPPQAWFRRTGAQFFNTAASGAPVGSVSYNYPGGGVVDITDMAGATWQVGGSSIRRPGEASPSFQLSGALGSSFTVTRDGVATTYARSVSGQTATMVVTRSGQPGRTIESNLSVGRPSKVTDEAGKITQYDYDPAGRLTRTTLPELGYTQYTVNGRGAVTEVRQVGKPGSGVADLVTTMDYGCTSVASCDAPTSVTDPRGATTTLSYDPIHGQVVQLIGPAATPGAAQPVTSYTYADVGGALQVSTIVTCATASSCAGSASEVRASFGYDVNGNLSSVSRGAGDGSLTATTTAGYDAKGDRVWVDGPLAGAGDLVRTSYDAARRVTATMAPDPDGGGARRIAATRTTLDAAGRATQVERGSVPSGATDWSGFAGAEAVQYGRDGYGRVLTETLVSGGSAAARTAYGYDGLGRLVCTAVRMDPGQWYGQADACSPQVSGPNGPDRVTHLGYDVLDRVETSTSAAGAAEASVEARGYTDDGQLAWARDGENNRTVYGYDGHDRPVRTSYPSPSKGANAANGGDYEEVTLDTGGLVTARRLRDGQQIGYGYDAAGRLTSVTRPGGVYWQVNHGYGYDLMGRLVQATDSNGRSLTFGYDALSRRTSQGDNWYGPGNASYGYDLSGRRVRTTWWDGFFVTYEHDAAGALTVVRENGGLALASYGHDALGRRTSVARANGTVTGYGYDAAGRLTTLTQDLAGGAWDLTISLGYNPAGQIASRTTSNDTYAYTGAYNIDRPYASDGLNRYTSAGTTGFGYDGRGNLTQSGGTTYGYTVDNQLATAPGANNAYDPLGRLFNVNGSGANTTLLYDGANVIAEVDGNTGGLTRRYVHGEGTDEPLVQYDGGGRRYLHADERGSVIALSDDAGNAVAINRYDEYGIPQAGNQGRFQYTGQKWIGELGLYDYKARMYSPTLGRFMQTDPIGYADGMNWYNYVGGDPVNSVDPSGLECFRMYENHGTKNTETGEITWQYAVPLGVCFEQTQGRASPASGSGSAPGKAPQKQCSVPRDSALGRAYSNARAEAFRRFDKAGGNKEVEYSIFRDNSSGALHTRYGVGGDSGTAGYFVEPGKSLVLSGHIHNRPVGEPFLAWSWPPYKVADPGPSNADLRSRDNHPASIFLLHENAGGKWRDICF